jgi:hypothetical protein
MQHTNDTYEVHIDFNESSIFWRQNKKSIGNGMYKYICPCITKKGHICGNVTWKNEECCYIHSSLKAKK